MNLAARSRAKLILCQCIMGFCELEILHEVFGTLWQYEIQSKAWQMRLMQPIYKGGDKSRADPESYRGIYLSSALAKLSNLGPPAWIMRFVIPSFPGDLSEFSFLISFWSSRGSMSV